jgi:hypothetical protein
VWNGKAKKTAQRGDNYSAAITLADVIPSRKRGEVRNTAREWNEHKDVGNWMVDGVR